MVPLQRAAVGWTVPFGEEGRVMSRWCAYWSGVLLIAVALVAVPSVAIAPSYAGGSAVDGSVEGGRYFVNPSHGRPIVEVSEATWRAVYWVERLWPWSVLVPGLTGLFLVGCGKGPNWKPAPPPPKEPPPWVLWSCLVSGWITIAGTWLFWHIVRVPWATMTAGWILICVSGGSVSWLWRRSLRQQSTAESDPAADGDRDFGS